MLVRWTLSCLVAEKTGFVVMQDVVGFLVQKDAICRDVSFLLFSGIPVFKIQNFAIPIF